MSGRSHLGGSVRFNRWALIAAPAAIFLALFFILPLVTVALRSVTEPPGAGLSNYARFIADEGYVRIFFATFRTALLTTAVCLVIGYPYAYLIKLASPRVAALLLLTVLLPLWQSALVRTYAWQVILRDTGILNEFLLDIGWISEPLALIRTPWAVVIGMSQVLLPFMVLILYAAMRRIDPDLGQAAASLGAPPATAFRRIFLPLSTPGVAGGSLLVFILALGFYITPELLGSPRDYMLSQVVALQISQRLDWGFGSAMGVILLAATLAVLVAASRLVRMPDLFGQSELR